MKENKKVNAKVDNSHQSPLNHAHVDGKKIVI